MIGDEIVNQNINDVSQEKMKEFLDLLVDLTNKNKAASNKVEDATKLVLTEIEFEGIDFSEYLSNLIS
jgi:predicted amino acid-binding ACT domain protein